MLNVFGSNVSTVSICLKYVRPNAHFNLQAEGSDWQRQRKLTATPFNEQKSSLVWAESLRQACDMVDSWLLLEKEGLKSTSEDTRTLALHVLAYAGFQKSYPFRSIAKDNEARQPSTYRDSLSIILKNVLVILVLPPWAFRIPFLPSKWTQIGWAISEFRRYMMGQLADERRLIAEGKPGSGTLMSNLVRASDTQPDAAAGDAQHRRAHDLKALSVDEILGNVFVFNFAGHDTTAISLAYSILLLVAHPETQDWISEELNFYLKSDSSEAWRYELVFPKLNRCLAVLVSMIVGCSLLGSH